MNEHVLIHPPELQQTPEALNGPQYFITTLKGKTISGLRKEGRDIRYVRHETNTPPPQLETTPSSLSLVAVVPGFLLPDSDYKTYLEQRSYLSRSSQNIAGGCYPDIQFVIPSLPDFAELFFTCLDSQGKLLIPDNEAILVRTSTQITEVGTLKPSYQKENFTPGLFASVGSTKEGGLIIDDVTISGANLMVLPVAVLPYGFTSDSCFLQSS